jgi:hypothetical protein
MESCSSVLRTGALCGLLVAGGKAIISVVVLSRNLKVDSRKPLKISFYEVRIFVPLNF